MLIAYALAVHADALDGEDAVFFAQPPAVHLVIWHNPEEDDAEECSQQTGSQEDDFPGLDCRAGLATSDCDAVGKTSTEDLETSSA